MVKIAIAGGAGSVASEIIDALVATQKHEIVVLTRREAPTATTPNVSYAKTSYEDLNELVNIFEGVHTVLSFLAPQSQEEGIKTQKNVIDACVKAGVKRFAPSEWYTAGLDHMPWYTFKDAARTYLAEINKDEKVLEYCLFQPGLFTNYLTRPYSSAKHVHAMETSFDFAGRRLILAEGSDDDFVVFTTVDDLAYVVARAVDYEGVWPVVGGIQGSKLSMKQAAALIERIRGGTVQVEKFSAESLGDGSWNPSWIPLLEHPSIPPEMIEPISKAMIAGTLLAIKAKAYEVSDEWNKILKDHKFQDAEEFLKATWEGKP